MADKQILQVLQRQLKKLPHEAGTSESWDERKHEEDTWTSNNSKIGANTHHTEYKINYSEHDPWRSYWGDEAIFWVLF